MPGYDFATFDDRVEVRQIADDGLTTTVCIIPINWSKEESVGLAQLFIRALTPADPVAP